ncbi:MAG: hypothetical protein ABIJ23_03740 [Candidatus Magasanikbacteria bacterium]
MATPLVEAKDYTQGQFAALLYKVKSAGATMEEVLSGKRLLQVVASDDPSVPHFTRLVNEAKVVSTLSAVMSEAEAGKLLENGQKCSVDHFGYRGSSFWLVRAGFTQKSHAPQLGPCYKEFEYLQDWDFEDQPTKDSVLFCPPRLLPNSLSKSVAKQNALLAKLREKYELPAHFFKSFGEPSQLSGIILANHNQTGERVPLNNLLARTDACIRDSGYRLSLGRFGRGGLDCDVWRWGGGGLDNLGCFALGVVDLG